MLGTVNHSAEDGKWGTDTGHMGTYIYAKKYMLGAQGWPKGLEHIAGPDLRPAPYVSQEAGSSS